MNEDIINAKIQVAEAKAEMYEWLLKKKRRLKNDT